MISMRHLLSLAVLAALLVCPPAPAQDSGGLDPVSVVLLEPRDPRLDIERARPFLEQLQLLLGERVPAFAARDVTVRLVTDPELAKRMVDTAELAIVPVGFWLGPLRTGERAAWPVAMIPRRGEVDERLRLVTTKAADAPSSLETLGEGRVVMQGAIDRPFLRRIVFGDTRPPAIPFALDSAPNLADEVFGMLEPEAGERPPAALLLDSAQWRFFQDDELIAPNLRTVWTSAPFPRDLVVALGDRWTLPSRAALRDALVGIGTTDLGRAVLKQMQSKGFAPIDPDQLEELAERYDARTEVERRAAAEAPAGDGKRDGGDR